MSGAQAIRRSPSRLGEPPVSSPIDRPAMTAYRMNTRPWSTLRSGTGRSHWSHGSWYHGAYPAGTGRGYNDPDTLRTGAAPISHDRAPDDVLGESTNLR